MVPTVFPFVSNPDTKREYKTVFSSLVLKKAFIGTHITELHSLWRRSWSNFGVSKGGRLLGQKLVSSRHQWVCLRGLEGLGGVANPPSPAEPPCSPFPSTPSSSPLPEDHGALHAHLPQRESGTPYLLPQEPETAWAVRRTETGTKTGRAAVAQASRPPALTWRPFPVSSNSSS